MPDGKIAREDDATERLEKGPSGVGGATVRAPVERAARECRPTRVMAALMAQLKPSEECCG